MFQEVQVDACDLQGFGSKHAEPKQSGTSSCFERHAGKGLLFGRHPSCLQVFSAQRTEHSWNAFGSECSRERLLPGTPLECFTKRDQYDDHLLQTFHDYNGVKILNLYFGESLLQATSSSTNPPLRN